MPIADLDAQKHRTIRDFGEQWTAFPDNEGYYGSQELMADIFEPLLPLGDLKDCSIADIGSGAGRIVLGLARAGAAKIYAVEPSQAIEVTRKNTTEFQDRIEYLNVAGDELPAALELDYVVAIGVLHHIPNPEPVVRAAHATLREGGKIFVWLYGEEGNGLYLAIFRPIRRIAKRFPPILLKALSWVLMAPLNFYLLVCKYLPFLPMREYMMNHIGKLSLHDRMVTIYDQLNPAWAKYYTRSEAEDLVSSAGFRNVKSYHRHEYSWSVLGEK